jgi:hypothetical protein
MRETVQRIRLSSLKGSWFSQTRFMASMSILGGHDKYQAVVADGAGITAIRAVKALQPAPLLNFGVRRPLVTVVSG